MPNLTELLYALQFQITTIVRKANIQLTNRKYSTIFDFWILVFIRLGRTSLRWLVRRRKHVYNSWNVKNALFDTKVITISGIWFLQDFG